TPAATAGVSQNAAMPPTASPARVPMLAKNPRRMPVRSAPTSTSTTSTSTTIIGPPRVAAGLERTQVAWRAAGEPLCARAGFTSGHSDTMIGFGVIVTMTRTTPPAPEPATRVAVSTVIFGLRRMPETGAVGVVLPLVRRTRDPHEGQWALPGGWLGERENLEAAASRTLAETTALAPSYLEQLYAFGDVDRSPSRVVSIVYWALVREDEMSSSREGAQENVAWFSATELPALAFDH